MSDMPMLIKVLLTVAVIDLIVFSIVAIYMVIDEYTDWFKKSLNRFRRK